MKYMIIDRRPERPVALHDLVENEKASRQLGEGGVIGEIWYTDQPMSEFFLEKLKRAGFTVVKLEG